MDTDNTSTRQRLEGALIVQHAAAHQATLLAWAQLPAAEIDLSAIAACDSAGVQLLCSARRSALSAGREWRLARPSEAVLRACADAALNLAEIGL